MEITLKKDSIAAIMTRYAVTVPLYGSGSVFERASTHSARCVVVHNYNSTPSERAWQKASGVGFFVSAVTIANTGKRVQQEVQLLTIKFLFRWYGRSRKPGFGI
ncbi:hypothetical protein [Niabella drilacis]|uniref:Uncharacterized protein n=1 Tax=Niabella drilacis (strain DSM 25811 / CCM 8410 / CCUG 62505 / LMG 26954 / E90) TaxID=1285928 RepID=A0A1G6XGF8_NIADE|nr:hypothetical protein [Niabella drilacis]SDD77314.1 hypothetical protein SAMN04487894_11369 [Niabella drilacis]